MCAMIGGVQCVPHAIVAGSDGITKKMTYVMIVATMNRKIAQNSRLMMNAPTGYGILTRILCVCSRY